jgi:chromosome segregation ATPase
MKIAIGHTWESLLQEIRLFYFITSNRINQTSVFSAMADLHSELTALHHKYENLRNDWNSQQENVGQMQAELFRVRSLVQQQSQFCASLGAVMGNLIWKASRLPPVVDMLLSGV